MTIINPLDPIGWAYSTPSAVLTLLCSLCLGFFAMLRRSFSFFINFCSHACYCCWYCEGNICSLWGNHYCWISKISWDGVFLVWNWVVLVFSYVLFSGLIEVSVLVKSVAGSPVGCCSIWCCSGSPKIVDCNKWM